jgi:hypothetical protein
MFHRYPWRFDLHKADWTTPAGQANTHSFVFGVLQRIPVSRSAEAGAMFF